MKRTVFMDKNSNEITVGNKVIYKDELYDVEVNPFNNLIVIDNNYGQVNLEDVHFDCEVV